MVYYHCLGLGMGLVLSVVIVASQFGRRLEGELRVSAWAKHYINYKGLKKLIKEFGMNAFSLQENSKKVEQGDFSLNEFSTRGKFKQ